MTNASLTVTNSSSIFYVGQSATSGYCDVLLKDSALRVLEMRLGDSGKTNSLVLNNSQVFAATTFTMGNANASIGNRMTVCGTNALLQAHTITIRNDSALMFEIPEKGWVHAPVQGTNSVSSITLANFTGSLSVEAMAFSLEGGGRVPLVYSANGSGLAVLKGAASFDVDGTYLDIEESGKLLVAYIPPSRIPPPKGTRIIVR
jgi:hypothetical protein